MMLAGALCWSSARQGCSLLLFMQNSRVPIHERGRARNGVVKRLFCLAVDMSSKGFPGQVADEPEPVLGIFPAIMGFPPAKDLVRALSLHGFKKVYVEGRIQDSRQASYFMP